MKSKTDKLRRAIRFAQIMNGQYPSTIRKVHGLTHNDLLSALLYANFFDKKDFTFVQPNERVMSLFHAFGMEYNTNTNQ